MNYAADHTFTQQTTYLSYVNVSKGDWNLEAHPTGGDGVMHSNVTISGISGEGYPFKIVDNNTMSNEPATPVVIFTRQ